MPLLTPPKGFVRRLHAYDPLLRIRWSDWETRWRVERRLTHARSIDPGLFREHQYEEHVARCQGYIPVMYAAREQLDNRVIFTLFMNDIQRLGGAQKAADMMEREEAVYRSASRAKWLADVYAQAREKYDYMNCIRVVPEKFRHTAPPGGMSCN
jgi:hypothetical protein